MSARAGLVSLVGAGPGAPDLLTLRAAKRLAEADVVLYDALVDRTVLDMAPRARCVDVGKRCGRHRREQSAIESLLVRLARRGLRVVRLKGGDPFVFGRGGEEAIALSLAGIACEVVPGVSNAVAAPALAGIPVTHRGLSSSFFVMSGHAPEHAAAAVRSLAPNGTTIVVFMPRAGIQTIARELLAARWSPCLPVAVIADASQESQQVVRLALRELAETAIDLLVGSGSPAVVVIGKTVALAADINQESRAVRPALGAG